LLIENRHNGHLAAAIISSKVAANLGENNIEVKASWPPLSLAESIMLFTSSLSNESGLVERNTIMTGA
jgi:hypothetical protein